MHIVCIENMLSMTDGRRDRQKMVRLGYCFTPYQRLWLYNGAPFVAFYNNTLGIQRTYSRLTPPASSRGDRKWIPEVPQSPDARLS